MKTAQNNNEVQSILLIFIYPSIYRFIMNFKKIIQCQFLCLLISCPLTIIFSQSNHLSIVDTLKASDCYNEGLLLFNNKDYRAALDPLECSSKIYLDLAKQTNDPLLWRKTINAWDTWGKTLAELRIDKSLWLMDPDIRRAFGKKAENIIKKCQRLIQIHLGHRDILLAENYRLLGVFEIDSSFAYLDSAIMVYEWNERPLDPKVAEVCMNTGTLLRKNNRFQETLPHYEKAIKIYKHAFGEKSKELANAYNDIGVIYYLLGEYKKTAEMWERSLLMRREVVEEGNKDLAHSLGNMGLWYSEQGDYEKASTYSLEALRLAETYHSEDKFWLATLYSALGLYAYHQGKLKEAQGYFKKQIATTKAGRIAPEGSSEYILAFAQVGELYHLQGMPDSAGHYLRLAEKMHSQHYKPNPYFIMPMFMHLGNYYKDLKDFRSALANFRQAKITGMQIYDPRHPDIQETILAIADTWYQMGEYDSSLTTLNALIPNENLQKEEGVPSEKESIWVSPTLIHAWQLRGDNYYQKAKKVSNVTLAKKSLASFQQAVAFNDTLFRLYTYETSQRNRLKDGFSIYQGGLRVALLLYELNSDPGFQELAFQFSERSKATILRQAIRQAKAISFAGIPDSVLTMETQYKRLVFQYQQEIRAEESKIGIPDSARLYTLRKQAFVNRQKLDALQQKIQQIAPRLFQLKYGTNVNTVSEIQSILKEQNTLIEYFAGDSTLYAFLISKNNFQIKELSITNLEKHIKDLRESIYNFPWQFNQSEELYEKTNQQYISNAYALYQQLIAPLGHLPENLIIIPDGLLNYIPFDVLLTQLPDNPDFHHAYSYLMQKHQISYCYSATLLKEMGVKNTKQPSKRFLAIAPEFTKKTTTVVANWTTRRSALGPLENNIPEAESIRSLIGGELLKSADATESEFLKIAADYQILHLATHAKSNDKDGDFSFLAFSEIADSIENEKLFVRDLYSLGLNAEMVVLSACETGIGELLRGEGVISLARGFTYAGVNSLITTLWSVDDQSTRQVMEFFYKNLKSGQEKDEALRNAKIDYLNSGNPKTHPYYWAGFIPVGSMESIKLNGQINFWWYIVGFSILVFGIVWYKYIL